VLASALEYKQHHSICINLVTSMEWTPLQKASLSGLTPLHVLETPKPDF